ncbi:MAG TPA: hypothetical protein VJ417_14480 [Candidatus Glassbacteria bacterium]|nr:hypothetical protein [Candidatus Glassbacteria bacterium]
MAKKKIKIELCPPGSAVWLEASADPLEPASFRKLAADLERAGREAGVEAGGKVLAHLTALPDPLVQDLLRLT